MTRRSEVGIDLVARDMASRAIGDVGGSLGHLEGAAGAAGRGVGLLGTIAHGVFNGVFLGVGMMAVNKLSEGLMSIPNAVIGMNASLEQSTLQFQTLFGGGAEAADRAREHVRMLFEFAKVTPFETGPIIQASRTLQTFGGDALNTQKNLLMIGDAAAGASADINEVSFWVGRAYAAIQGGQPFGEARMRLQELALLSPKAAQEMERLQKAGASANEVWRIMEGELGRFNGAMKLQADTWGGLTSTLSDTVKLTLADAFKPFFEYAKDGLRTLITLFSSPAFGEGLRAISSGMVKAFEALGTVLTPVVEGLRSLMGVVREMKILDQIPVAFDAISKVVRPLVEDYLVELESVLEDLGETFEDVVRMARPFVEDVLEAMGPILQTLYDNFDTIASFLTGAFIGPLGIVINLFNSLDEGVNNVGESMALMQQSVLEDMGVLIEQLVPQLANLAAMFANWIMDALPVMLDNLATYLESMLGWAVDHADVILGKLAEWGLAFVGWLLPMIPELFSRLLQFVVRMVGWILFEGVPRLTEAMKRLGKSMLDGVLDKITGRDGGKGLIGGLLDVVLGLLGSMVGWADNIMGGALSMAWKFIEGFLKPFAEFPKKVADTLVKAFRSIKVDVGPFHISGGQFYFDTPTIDLSGIFKGFATGAWRIPQDMVAMIHKDEMIVPADIANRLRAAAGASAGTPREPGFSSIASPVAAGNVVYQTFNFGPGSVRNDDDIRRIGQEIAERAQLQGFTATVRQVGRVTV
jgi:hypothetical protein